jgi:hypothetical protein
VPSARTLIGFFWPAQSKALLEQAQAQGATVFAMDMIPRTLSRGQVHAARDWALSAGCSTMLSHAPFLAVTARSLSVSLSLSVYIFPVSRSSSLSLPLSVSLPSPTRSRANAPRA